MMNSIHNLEYIDEDGYTICFGVTIAIDHPKTRPEYKVTNVFDEEGLELSEDEWPVIEDRDLANCAQEAMGD